MSNVYLVPASGDFDSLNEVVNKVGLKVSSPQSVREFILQTASEPISIVACRAEELMVLNRFSQTLLDSVPSAVMSVPGLVYDAKWMSVVQVFIPMDWRELEAKLSKSGTMATSLKGVDSRKRGALFESLDEPSEASLYNDEDDTDEHDI